jgi:hypothetical protein
VTEWHHYAHAGQARAVGAMVFVSLVLAWVWGLVQRTWIPSIPWWLDTPAVIGIYGIAFQAYDGWAWNWHWVRFLHGVPDCSGDYALTIRSSHDGLQSELRGTVKIRQTWTRIIVRVETGTSTSVSKGGYLVEAPGEGARLVYLYHNTPRGQAVAEMSQHEGTASLVFSGDGTTAVGTYYTGRGRRNHGELELQRL